jgi:DNA replication protein DnaC
MKNRSATSTSSVENEFDSTTVATAIADRLVNNSEVIIMEGPSYRTKQKAKDKMIEK